MPTQAQIDDEILFWLGQQEREHMMLMVLGVQEPNIRAEALKLHQTYEAAAARQDTRTLLTLTGPSQALKRAAQQAATTGWIGFLYPGLYGHMIDEVDYALKRAAGQMTPRDATCFWAKERAELAIVTAKLLDPSETEMTKTAMQHHVNLRDLQNACRRPSMDGLSTRALLQAVTALDRFEEGDVPRAKNIIPPMLAAHELREGRRAEAILAAMSRTPTTPGSG